MNRGDDCCRSIGQDFGGSVHPDVHDTIIGKVQELLRTNVGNDLSPSGNDIRWDGIDFPHCFNHNFLVCFLWFAIDFQWFNSQFRQNALFFPRDLAQKPPKWPYSRGRSSSILPFCLFPKCKTQKLQPNGPKEHSTSSNMSEEIGMKSGQHNF